MAIAVVFEFAGADVAQYHKVTEIGGDKITDQPKRISHVCYRTDDGFTVVDVWEDEAAFQAFGPVIGPAIAQAGLAAEPRVYPVEGTM
jgi:hypothetical protein